MEGNGADLDSEEAISQLVGIYAAIIRYDRRIEKPTAQTHQATFEGLFAQDVNALWP